MARIRPFLTFSSRFDLRFMSGATLWARDTATIAFPAFDAEADEGVFEGVYDLAHSRGSSASLALALSRRDLSSALQAQWDAAAYATIGRTDRVELWGPAAFAVLAGADNPLFGIPAAGLASVAEGGAHVVRGTTAWSRDVVEGAQLQIQVGADPGFFIPDSPLYRAQNVCTLIRRRGRKAVLDGGAAGPADADDMAGALCLEALDNAAADAGLHRIRHYLGDDGHYTIAWPTSIGLDPPKWSLDIEPELGRARYLRDRLGFTGLEVPVDVGGVTIFRADKPVRGVLSTARPWRRRPRPLPGEAVDAERLQEGGAGVDHVASWVDHVFDFWLDGPDSPSTADDLAAHYADQVLRYMPRGKPITVTVGRDLRRRIRPSDVTAEVPPFSLLYSTALCSGCWRVVRSVDDAAEVQLEYDEELGGDFWARAGLRVGRRRSG